MDPLSCMARQFSDRERTKNGWVFKKRERKKERNKQLQRNFRKLTAQQAISREALSSNQNKDGAI